MKRHSLLLFIMLFSSTMAMERKITRTDEINFVDHGCCDTDFMEEMFALGIDINVQNDEGNTCLITCAERGFAGTIGWILSRPGIRVNMKNNLGETALIAALKYFKSMSDVKRICVAQLLAAGASVNDEDDAKHDALYYALKEGYHWVDGKNQLYHGVVDIIRWLYTPQLVTLSPSFDLPPAGKVVTWEQFKAQWRPGEDVVQKNTTQQQELN